MRENNDNLKTSIENLKRELELEELSTRLNNFLFDTLISAVMKLKSHYVNKIMQSYKRSLVLERVNICKEVETF